MKIKLVQEFRLATSTFRLLQYSRIPKRMEKTSPVLERGIKLIQDELG